MTLSTRTKLIVALILVICVIGLLIRTAVTQASTYYVTVSELYRAGSQAAGEHMTVSGNIVGSSVKWDPSRPLLQFDMQDNTQGKSLPVVFHGPKPQDFTNGWPVIVTGKLNESGQFEASTLLIKCPSKYESKPQTYTAESGS